MSDAKHTEEPSIEEILGSIRRIIADDDDQQAEAQTDDPVAAPTASPAAQTDDDAYGTTESLGRYDDDEDSEDEPLELTQKVDEDGTVIDIQDTTSTASDADDDIAPAAPRSPAPAAFMDEIVMVEKPHQPSADTLVSHVAADATAAVMARLARSTSISRPGNEGATLEDLVKDMLRPMLSEWLDQNLPSLVQNMVERELDKIARRVA